MKTLRLIAIAILDICSLALILAVVLVFPQVRVRPASLLILYRSLIAVAAGSTILLSMYYVYIRPLQISSIHPKITPIPPGRAVSLQRRVGRTRQVTSLEAQIFALAVTNPALLRPRVAETYKPSRRTVSQNVTIDIQIPAELFSRPAAHASGNGVTAAQRAGQQFQGHQGAAGLASTAIVPDNNGLPSGDAGPDIESSARANRPQPAEGPESPKVLVLPFPAVVPIKGELNDDFEVYGIDGERLPTYSYSEYLELVAGVLRMLLLKACDLEDKRKLHRSVAKAELAALRCIMQRGLQESAHVARAVTGILDLKELDISDESETPRNPNSDVISLIAELVRQLANRYAIVASIECNSEYRSLLRYQRTMVPGLSLSRFRAHPVRWLKERLAISLGARPVLLNAPLTTAVTCQSYHLVVRCPEGLYLRSQEFPGLTKYLMADTKRREDLRQAKQADVTIPPYYHIRSRLGQPYAHFYSRHFAEPTSAHHNYVMVNGKNRNGDSGQQMTNTGSTVEEFPKAEFTFLEVPPGSLFRGTIASISAFLLIWIVGFIASKGGDPGTDAPAVLLAFPAVLAGWLGVDAPPRRLLEGTLTARLSLAGTAVFAVAASALYMIYRANIPLLRGPIRLGIDMSFLGISEASWGILSALALANAIYVTYCWLKCTWEYKSLCARRSPLEHVIEGG